MAKYTIMTVDNEPDTVALIKETLEKAGYDVITATSGRECLEKLKKFKVDLILLDIMMPDISGWDVYERIKKEDIKVKIAFLTILESSPERIAEFMGVSPEGIADVVDYITKPFSPEDLIRRIEKILK